jgi:Domain of unknown function (DUF3786)
MRLLTCLVVGNCLRLNFDEGEVERLKRLAGSSRLEFLGYVVNLDSREIHDSLKETADVARLEFEVLQVLLKHYAKAEPVARAAKLVKFADLPGGRAYEEAFLQRAVQPVAEAFGDEPEKLVECAERFGGFALSFGDCSVEIPTLPRIPLTIIIWRKSEFPAQANILYDETASNYLPTEDLAVLSELTTARLLQTPKKN